MRSFFRRRGASEERTRILFATDLHAAELTFRKFLNSVSVYNVDVLVLGGDLTGKVLAPLIERDGAVQAELLGEPVTARGESEIDELTTRLRNLGMYPVRVDSSQFERLREDVHYREELMLRECMAQVRRWMKLAEARLAHQRIPLYATGGNDDDFAVEDVLTESAYVCNAEGRAVALDAVHEMVSSGYSNMTPWSCPRDISEHELRERLDDAVSGVKNVPNCVFNLHVPPYDSGLDLAARLDTSVQPPRALVGELIPVGSSAVRDAIEEYQPLVALHGHIHESRGITKIGRTVCINPGSEYAEGVLRAAIIDIANGRVLNAQLVSG